MQLEKPQAEAPAQATPLKSGAAVVELSRKQWRSFILALTALVACFGMTFIHLFDFAWHDLLYSYIILMPVVCGYLANLQKPASVPASEPLRGLGVILLLLGAGVMSVHIVMTHQGVEMEMEDHLSMSMLAFYFCLWGVSCIFLGRKILRRISFPLGMVIFMVPMPSDMQDAVVEFLQYGSASVAEAFFHLARMPVLRDDLTFILPHIKPLQVAPECSGIHSSWILLITTLIAAHLFLRTPWKKGVLAAAVIPLALLRNGFRVFTLGELCVHIGQRIIDSPIHHKGGPIFFALSLVPFFILLAWLHRSERGKKQEAPKPRSV